MIELQVRSIPFPANELARWKQGDWGLLDRLKAESQIARILKDKTMRRQNLGRRFFGEAWAASSVAWDHAWYGSFKWLTSSPGSSASLYGREYREALREHFGDLTEVRRNAMACLRYLGGKRPMPPDLWLIHKGVHHFVEVKLPGDRPRDPQLAGLAVIAASLKEQPVKVWIHDLHPSDKRSAAVSPVFGERYAVFLAMLGKTSQMSPSGEKARSAKLRSN